MLKHKPSRITDFLGKTGKCTESETLTEDDSETFDVASKHADTQSQDSKTVHSYEKKFKQDWLFKPA
jgi:hypothetical protein